MLPVFLLPKIITSTFEILHFNNELYATIIVYNITYKN